MLRSEFDRALKCLKCDMPEGRLNILYKKDILYSIGEIGEDKVHYLICNIFETGILFQDSSRE